MKGTFGSVAPMVTEDGQTIAVKRPIRGVGERQLARELLVYRWMKDRGVTNDHVVHVFNSSDEDGLLMEWQPTTLLDVNRTIARTAGARWNAQALAYVFGGICRGVREVHVRAGVTHGDIKPNNILIADRGAILADFGAAKMIGEPHDPMCCFSYVPPEVLVDVLLRKDGEKAACIMPPADWWAIGCMLYSVCMGMEVGMDLPRHLQWFKMGAREKREAAHAALERIAARIGLPFASVAQCRSNEETCVTRCAAAGVIEDATLAAIDKLGRQMCDFSNRNIQRATPAEVSVLAQVILTLLDPCALRRAEMCDSGAPEELLARLRPSPQLLSEILEIRGAQQ